jgi:hypothetical protein
MLRWRRIFLMVVAAGALALGGCGGDGGGGGGDTGGGDVGPGPDVVGSCGDGVIDTGERCDGANLGAATCASEGFAGGSLACSATCQLDTSGCTDAPEDCGNGVLDAGEACDGAALNGQTCAGLGHDGGTLACTAACTFDESGCTDDPDDCGNGVLDAGEQCDGAALNGQTCAGLGHDGGTLGCTAACTFDESGCTDAPEDCGNGVLDAGEDCDGAELNGQTCAGLGHDGGTLDCTAACTFDESGCTDVPEDCGNGVLDAGEQCDGAELNGQTCAGLGHDGGTLACTAACTFDESGCTDAPDDCGNGVLDAGEACDGAELNGQTCEGLGYDGGTLGCTAACAFDTSACTGTPPCADDAYEPNDDQATAAALAAGTYALVLCNADGGEEDWFALTLLAGQVLVVTADFEHDDLDIDLDLLDGAGVELDSSLGSGDRERVEYVAAADETVYLVVSGYTTGQAPYTLTIVDDLDCLDDDDCAAGEVCQGNVCLVPGCFTDSDCLLGQVCVDHACADTTCATDADCTTYGLVCDAAAGWCVECLTAADCDDEDAYACDANVCVLQCVEDAFEPNSARESAAPLSTGTYDDLTLCGARDNDWFRIEVVSGYRYDIDLLFTHADGDIDLYVVNSSGASVLSSISSTDNEHLAYYPTPENAGTYYVRVYLYSIGVYAHTYDLVFTATEVQCRTDAGCAVGQVCQDDQCIDTTCAVDADCDAYDLVCDEAAGYCVECAGDDDCGAFQACVANRCEFACADDEYEENDTQAAAATLALGTHDLVMCDPGGSEEDWFAIDVAAGEALAVYIAFVHSQGDLELGVYNANGTAIRTSTSSTNSETVERPAGLAGTVWVRVWRLGSGASTYQLTASTTAECTADSQCGGGFICQALTCVAGCRSDSGCGAGFICQSLQCVAGCRFDSQCDAGFICQSLQCVAGCRFSSNCPEGQVCDDTNHCIVPGCLRDADCQLGEVCEDYACLATTCAGDAECVTYGFVCDEAAGWCVECTADGECGAGEGCIDYRCVFLCDDDAYEPNDTKATAAPITPGTYTDLAICEAPGSTEEDWYAVDLAAGDILVVRIDFVHATADLELRLLRLDSTTALASSLGITNQEQVVYTATAAMTVYIQVYSSGTGRGAPYEMTVFLADCRTAGDCQLGEACVDFACQLTTCAADAECDAFGLVCDEAAEWCVQCVADEDCPAGFGCVANACELGCVEDAYEPNSSQADAAAVDLAAADFAETGLTLCGRNDADWFTFELAPETKYQIVASFVHSAGDIDIFLSRQNADGTLTQVRSSTGTGNSETIDYVTDAAGGTFFLRVYLYSFSPLEHTYDLRITTVGAIECQTDGDCGALQLCRANFCVDVDCITAADCLPGEDCVGNTCVAPGAGDTCGAAIPVDILPFVVDDAAIASFANDLEFATSGESCTGYRNVGRDAIYAVSLTTGEQLRATAIATFDVVLYILSDCSVSPIPASACLDGADDTLANEAEVVTYTATADITVYVVVDYWSTGPSMGTFDLTLELL